MGIDNPIWKKSPEIGQQNVGESLAEYHASKQLENLKSQADLILNQAQEIQERLRLTRLINESASFNFKPVHLKTYYLYHNKTNNQYTLTLIAPKEWKNSCPYGEYKASVRQLGDSTWEAVSTNDKDNTNTKCNTNDNRMYDTENNVLENNQ